LDKAMQRLKRLVDIQQARANTSCVGHGLGKRIDQTRIQFSSSLISCVGIAAPFVMTSFLPGARTTLRTIAIRIGWATKSCAISMSTPCTGSDGVTVPVTALPDLDKGTPVRLDPKLDTAGYAGFRRLYLKNLSETLDFSKLRPEQTRAFLGGLFPEVRDPGRALEAPPWASLQATFLLRRPQDRPLKGVEVEIEIPARPELFPFSLKMLLDGADAAEVHVERANENGRYRSPARPRCLHSTTAWSRSRWRRAPISARSTTCG